MVSLTPAYHREDYTRPLTTPVNVAPETVQAFFDFARGLNFYDDQSLTVGELFERDFPGREDIVRLLMEPITYANGSTLEDPAITYGIVFSNFMSKGVYTFEGGTDRLIEMMHADLVKSGVDVRIKCDAQQIVVENGKVAGVIVNGRPIKCRSVVSNSNLRHTILSLVGAENLDPQFVEEARAVRLNNSSTQVYMALKPDERLDEGLGDLFFTSTAPVFRTDLLLSKHVTSRTYSFYYPRTRPQGRPRCLIVSSTNANYSDWANLSEEDYEASKRELVETTLDHLGRYIPNVRERIDHVEAATPKTFEHYTQHVAGASFGTKFEGLAVSRGLPDQIRGLYHAGSVGIIMSGWLGAINYGVIVANDVDALLVKGAV
jgi:phytoene dehydrogenase-like protein